VETLLPRQNVRTLVHATYRDRDHVAILDPANGVESNRVVEATIAGARLLGLDFTAVYIPEALYFRPLMQCFLRL
jgi:hypothetical protein